MKDLKWLLLLGLAVVGAVFVAQNCFGPGRSDRQAEADSLRTAHQESLAVWTKRVDSLSNLSGRRDSTFSRDSMEEAIADSIGHLAGNRIAKLRQQLGLLTEVRDSNRVLVTIVSEQDARFSADSLVKISLRRQRDSMRIDRNDWKRAAGGLLAQVRRDSITIDRLVEMVKDECSYLIVKGPCPKVVVGPGVGAGPDGVHVSYLSITAGIPIRLPGLSGKRAASPP